MRLREIARSALAPVPKAEKDGGEKMKPCGHGWTRQNIPCPDCMIVLRAVHAGTFGVGASSRISSLENGLREARELFLDYQLGHPHDAKQKHIRIMGDTYGWCDFCQEKVNFEEDPAKKMVAAIDSVLGEKP